MDGQGNLLDFGTPQAKTTLAQRPQRGPLNLLPQAQAAIKKQTDERLLATVVNNGSTSSTAAPPSACRTRSRPSRMAAPRRSTAHTPYYRRPGGPSSPFKGFSRSPELRHGRPPRGRLEAQRRGLPVPVGTQIVAPMQGTVIKAFSNARGGNQVRVKMADGAIVGFAHLSKTNVKQGDAVSPGQLLGLSGATGHATGPTST
jgi:murein DD-endopeptidase MepM/ murein hydrolase activator NlpD